jgi:hypothetical protein
MSPNHLATVLREERVTEALHPAARDPLPAFITAPGETDVLMVVMGVFLVLFVIIIGVLYFRLHALPDRFAHKKVQFEIVCVLGLIAMFTHMHIFWIAGLLLAMIDFPDLGTPLKRIANSAENIANIRMRAAAAKRLEAVSAIDRDEQSAKPSRNISLSSPT